MKIPDLITIAENRLMNLNQSMATTISQGDLETISLIEEQVLETQAMLDSLRQLG